MRWRLSIIPVISLLAATSAIYAQSGTVPATDPRMRMPDLPPAEIDETLSIAGEEIEAQKRASRMTVEVAVNGRGPYRFVVDSGADTSVIGSSLAGKLALPEGRRVFLHGITESRMVETARVESLALGSTETLDLELPVLEEQHLGADGMIGLDALVRQRLMMDFEKRVITVGEEVDFADMGGPGVIVVTGRLHRGQLILTQVSADNQKVETVVDTGSQLTIGNLAMRDKLRKRNPAAFSKIEVQGVTGKAIDLEMVVVSRLKVGPILLENVPIAFADVAPFGVFGLKDRPALLLGTDLMENFRRVSLDFEKRKARFQLKRCATRGVVVRTVRNVSRLSADRDTACN